MESFRPGHVVRGLLIRSRHLDVNEATGVVVVELVDRDGALRIRCQRLRTFRVQRPEVARVTLEVVGGIRTEVPDLDVDVVAAAGAGVVLTFEARSLADRERALLCRR